MSDPDVADRALHWARRRSARWGRRNPWVVAVQVARNAVEDRVGGLAAEMAFWALLSLLPLLVAIAALLGYAERVIGLEDIRSGQAAIVAAGSVVFSAELTREVVTPFVSGLLSQGQGGVAVTSLAIALYLASRVFTATIRALDLAYRVPERRGLVRQRLIAVGMAAGFVVLAVTALALTLVGPVIQTGDGLLGRLAQWPVLLALMVVFLAAVYHWAPNLPTTFREGLPGAVLGVILWVLASVGLRLFLAAGGGGTSIAGTGDQAVALVGRVVGAVVAALLWTYVTGLAMLLGGELNAELARYRSRPDGVRAGPPSETMRSHEAGGAQGG